jgi:hypothetical protein
VTGCSRRFLAICFVQTILVLENEGVNIDDDKVIFYLIVRKMTFSTIQRKIRDGNEGSTVEEMHLNCFHPWVTPDWGIVYRSISKSPKRYDGE